MSGWFRRILYFLCILEISSANPTRAPDVIKDEEEIKFQNKLPEDTLELETGVVRRPLNVTNHRIDQLGNSQSPSREDGKHHCPFCKYASNIGASIENQELDSDSAQPYLIIGNIKPVTGETNIITEEDVPQDTNSTWNPQNEIKAILKVPDGSSNGKEYKRCTHSDSVLGGSSQKTELHNLLNNPEVSNNIDFSCCNTLRKILLHALRLEGKCLCSEPRATSPIINITAIKDNDFEKEIIRQEFPPIFIRQQQNTPPKLIDQEKGAGNNLLGKGDTKTIKHNKENRESNSPGTQDEKDNITSFGSGIQDLKTNSNESAVTLNSIHNTSQITDGKIEGYNTNHEKNIDVKQLIVEEDNELSTPLENNTSITETRKQSEPSSEAEEEHVNTSSELSSVNTFATVVPPAGENGVNYSSIKPNVKLEQVSKEYPRESVTKVNYTSTDNTNNGTLGLNVDQVIYNNSLKEELNGNKEKIDHFYNVENYYTTESFLLVMENKELNSTNIPDNLTEMNMQFSEGSTQSNQEQTQVIETQTLNSMIINNYNDSDIIFKEEANQIDGDSLETPAINKDLLQSKSGNHLLENELFLLEREEMFLAENESSTAMIEDRNNFSTTNHTEYWPDVNSMSTTAYELGHHLEIENLLLEPKHNTINTILLTAGPSISPTNLPELSEEPSGENKTQLQDEYKDSQNILKNSHSLDEGGRPSKMPYEDAEILEQTMFQQNTSTDTPINNENFNLTRENYAEISSIDSPRNFTHTQISPRQNSFYNELMVQQTSTTENFIGNKITERVTDITSRDFSPGFEVESLTTESILQEKSSTPGLEVSSVTAKSTSYETTNTELLMENQMPSLSTENTLSINSSDCFKNNKQSSSEEYALGTEYSQYADSDFTTGKPSEIRMSDPIEYNHELIPGEIENISQQSQKAKNVPPNGLEQGNYILGSIQTKSSQTQPTNNHLEGEMMNLATESPSVIKLSDSLGNSRLEETTKIDHQSRNSQDILSEELQQSNNILSLIQTESAQTQTTENPLGREVSTLTTGIPSDIGFNNSMKNNPPGETENMEQLKSGQTENMEQLKRGQIILSGSPEPDNYILGSIQTSEVESSTFPTEHVSTLAYLDMNIGTVATDTSLSSQFKGDKTNQNQHYIFSSAETTTSEVLLSTDKIDKNEVSHETSTGIDYEMDNAEDILKSLIDGFKKTHLSENSEDKNLTDNTEITLMETSTSVTLLESIKELEFSNKPNNEVPINIGTYTDQSKSIKHNFDFDSSADNVESILQNVQISSTSTDDVFLESTTMSSDNVTPTKMSSDDIPATSTSISNITGIQHSSEMNNTLKSHVNFVDYDKYLAVINELHKFSTDNQSTEFESLRDSDSASTLPPYSSFQILNKKDTTAESSLSAINLFTPRPIDDDDDDELTLMSQKSESTSAEAEHEKGSDKGVRQNLQDISNPNFVSLLPNDLQTAITNTIDQKSEFDISNTFPAKTTKISIWNNVTPVISDTSSNLRQSLSSRVEPQVNKLNSTDLEEEILSTGNYIVHHVNVSMNDSYEDLNKNLQVTSNTNLHSGNMMLEEFETTTMNTKHLEDNHRDLSFGYPTSKLSEGSKLIESTTIELLKSDNENTDSTQTEISDIHSPLIVCLPQEDSHQLNTDLLGSRFFIQNEANIIELDLVRRNVGLCGCPHNSYELKPKSRVSKADMNLLKSLEGQHISMILRRADKIPDKTADNYETTTGNYYLQEEYLDLDKKKMEMSEITPVKLDANDDKSGNQVLGNKHVGNNKESEEKHSCNCQCLGNLNPTKVMLENKKESQYPRSKDIDRGQERSRKSQIKKLEPESIMKLDKVKSDHEEGANYKRKYNRGRQHSRRLNFPIMVDKDLLKRFNSVYRPYNYFRRS
ncbi:hypothetical protein LSTR_LSTR008435 [Laodelphax striatellus]|uniref:Uncharacterized protein n=1 Tax=Laodelphax striatellus TaxID=195883 RepID=A0A482XV64_LAOST|nr:hypothetical protein LSTR_LSTR008435 [Laodelphax striatellus]